MYKNILKPVISSTNAADNPFSHNIPTSNVPHNPKNHFDRRIDLLLVENKKVKMKLDVRIKNFLDSPQPPPPYSSLRMYKNPAQEILVGLLKDEQEIEEMIEDGEEGEEEKVSDIVMMSGTNTLISKSKWADARHWYYTTKQGDGVCSYLRIPQKKNHLTSIYDVWKELTTPNLEE